MSSTKMVMYYDYVGGESILIAGERCGTHWPWPKEVLGGMVFEVESKIIRTMAHMLELGAILQEDLKFILKEGQSLEDIDEEAVHLVWGTCIYELPVTMSEGQLRAYIDRYTRNVIPWLHDQRRVEWILDKIEQVKDYLVPKLPHLKFYTLSSATLFCGYNVDELQAAIVFADTSKETPTFLYLAYGLEPAPNGCLSRKDDYPPRFLMTQQEILDLQSQLRQAAEFQIHADQAACKKRRQT